MTYHRLAPFPAKILAKELLSKPGSSKQTYHLSLSIRDSGLQFRPGDSIGIYPENDPHLVERACALLRTSPQETVLDPRSKIEMSAQEFLSKKVNFSRISSSLLHTLEANISSHDPKSRLQHLLAQDNKELLLRFLQERDLLDLLREFPEYRLSIQELAQHTSPLLPRFYSIASSSLAHPEEVHITVALLSYSHHGEERYGVASHFLCHLADIEKTKVPLYIQPSSHFHLPEDPHANLIMVGPGTGIAPYRAFMQERIHKEATGKHWLFFGERNRAYDFLYESYWTSLVQSGKLRMDVAFSRDQKQKTYVQHKLYEHAKELFAWIAEGAYFYLCGDATHMAKDVEQTLLQLFQEQGNLSAEEAKSFLKNLKQTKRYLTDVY